MVRLLRGLYAFLQEARSAESARHIHIGHRVAHITANELRRDSRHELQLHLLPGRYDQKQDPDRRAERTWCPTDVHAGGSGAVEESWAKGIVSRMRHHCGKKRAQLGVDFYDCGEVEEDVSLRFLAQFTVG